MLTRLQRFSLQPGERRLSEADELARTAQRVAKIKAAQDAGGSVSNIPGGSGGDVPIDPCQPQPQPHRAYLASGTLGAAMRIARRSTNGGAGNGVGGFGD